MSTIQNDGPVFKRIHALMHALSEQTDIPVDRVSHLLSLYESLRPYPSDLKFEHDHPVPLRMRPHFSRALGDVVFGAEQALEIMRGSGIPNLQMATPSGGVVAVFVTAPTGPAKKEGVAA